MRHKVLYQEALPEGQTLNPFVYHSDRKGTTIVHVYLSLKKVTPFMYLLKGAQVQYFELSWPLIKLKDTRK